ncbi:MAG: PHP domain-containing protein [Lachnospiraceae bacterium]|nr:PHP domain-containing protein [Lachnospiraceae bacterium]
MKRKDFIMIDLHVHSNHSDGTLSPEELVELAVKTGLSAFALTDHDTVSGIAKAKEAAARFTADGQSVTVISGTEISAAYKKKDIHILGLFIDETNPVLLQNLEQAVAERGRRNEKMAERFRALGIPLTLEELCRENPDTVITRAHFAKYLSEKNYVKTREEAFQRYLSHEAPCFVPREYMQPEQAISLILNAGGIPVLAHPLLYKLKPNELDSLLERLTAAGLKGLEVFYSSNTSFDESIAYSLANRFGLLMTGGSDFHGSNKPNIHLGSGRNHNLNIPDSVLEPLLALAK